MAASIENGCPGEAASRSATAARIEERDVGACAAGVRYLAGFFEQMEASGFLAEALRRLGDQGAAIALPVAR